MIALIGHAEHNQLKNYYQYVADELEHFEHSNLVAFNVYKYTNKLEKKQVKGVSNPVVDTLLQELAGFMLSSN